MGVGGGRRPFFMHRRPRNGPQQRRRGGRDTHPQDAETPGKPRKTAIPGVIRKEEAARRRPGSHSSRPKRTSFAALEDSIADGAANGKGVMRANEALERANFARKTETSAQISADWGVRGPCEACAASARNRAKSGTHKGTNPSKQWDGVPLPVFPGVLGV